LVDGGFCFLSESTTTEETATSSTESVCQPSEEICDEIDPEVQPSADYGASNNCDGSIDENVNCGNASCDASLNLTGSCQNPCNGISGCGTCTPTCTCIEGYSDCDGDMANGCEIQGDCQPTP